MRTDGFREFPHKARHSMQRGMMRHMTSHTTRETQLAPLSWALQLQEKHSVFLTGTAASPIRVTLLYDTVPIVGFTQLVHSKIKTEKQTFKERDNSPVCNTLQTFIVGAGPIELLGCKSVLLRG